MSQSQKCQFLNVKISITVPVKLLKFYIHHKLGDFSKCARFHIFPVNYWKCKKFSTLWNIQK